jgi:4-hydroxybenzoate polyprenyltransferase
MSLGTPQKVFSGIQEVLFLVLMLVTVFALLYVNIDLMYKIGIGAMVFTIMFLMMMATQILNQQKDERKAAAGSA